MPPDSRGTRIFWGAALTVLVLDAVTKWFAERHLALHQPMPVVGEWVRWTLSYNPGAAFSFHLGPYSRYIFGALALVALVVLWRLFREGSPALPWARLRALAIGLVWGGAFGNLVDRIRHPRGVVDFIDVGIGDARFYTFNVADAGVSVGAVLLALVLFREDRELARLREGGGPGTAA